MGKISSTIELQDNFTNVLYQVMDSVNMCISATADLSSAMNQPVDTAAMQRATLSVDGARDALNHAYTAAQRLDSAMQSISSPKISVPEISQSEPAGWQSYKGIEVFTNTGIERFEQELSSVNAMMDTLHDKQFEITMESNDTAILSPDAAYDIKAAESRVQSLINLIKQTEDTSIDAGTDTANSNLEKLRAALSETISLENNLKEAMNGTDLSQVNSAYLQLSQNISNTERLVRDSFSSPVEIPVTWKTDNLEVFAGTGIERFRQEVQSANGMLDTLGTTQNRIASAASQMNIFPPSAIAGMNNMGNRLQAIQQRIRQIESNPLNMGTETANSELEQLRSQLSRALHEQQNLNNAVDEMDVSAANEAYLRLSQTIGGTERYIRDNVSEQGRFNQQIDEGTQKSGKLAGMIKKAVGAYATFQTLGKVIDLSDTMAQTSARLNLIVDDGGSVDELQDKIYLSAQRSRAAYQSTADAIAKMGSNAGSAFASNDELIAFMEQINKQFTIGGATAQDQSSALLQLSQAMAAGALRGEELNSILDAAPGIARSIEQNMGWAEGSIKSYAEEGAVTAQVVKESMLNMADETNAKFKSMPMTFSQVWTSFQNTALMAFQPVLEELNGLANSDAFQLFVSNATMAIAAVAGVITRIFTIVVSVVNFISQNWAVISPILYGVITALAIFAAYLLLLKVYSLAYAAVQAVVNAILAANPIMLIVGAIVLCIAAIFAVATAIARMTGIANSGFGVITGGVNVVIQFFKNLGLEVANIALGIWEALKACASNLQAAFHNAISNVQSWFYNLLSTALSVIDGICEKLNKLPFVEFDFSGITSAADDYAAKAAEAAGNKESYTSIKDAFSDGMSRFDTFQDGWVSDAFKSGAEWGDGISDKISNAIDGFKDGLDISGTDSGGDLGNYGGSVQPINNYDDIDNGVGDIADNTADIADDMDITEEELKYLRDIAEQETVNRFTTAEINIEQTNHNNISSEMDLDGIVSGLTDAVKEATSIAAEGVHV